MEPFIRHIRFPRYKNFEPNSRIDFSFPITAIVGANGTNKSSIIKALYGCPEKSSLGNFWFSTALDPIKETDDELVSNCINKHSYGNMSIQSFSDWRIYVEISTHHYL